MKGDNHPLDRCRNCNGFRSEHIGPEPVPELNCIGFHKVFDTEDCGKEK